MKTTVAFSFLCFVSLTFFSFRLAPAVENKPKHAFLSSRRPGQIDRVKVQLKVGGEGIDVADGKEQREKMSVACNLEYAEKTLEIPTNDPDSSRSIRFYNQAEVEIKVGERDFKPALRPERSLIVAEISPHAVLLFSPRGSLTREELELIDVQGNSLLLDRLLPDKPVAVGDV